MVETLAEGSGSKEGLEGFTSIDGEPDPFWSEAERLALEAELADLERIVKAAPVAGKVLWHEIAYSYSDSDEAPRINVGPYKRLGSVALTLN